MIDTFIGFFRQFVVWPKPCPLSDVNEIHWFQPITWPPVSLHQHKFRLRFRLSWTERRRDAIVNLAVKLVSGLTWCNTTLCIAPNVYEFGNSRRELPTLSFEARTETLFVTRSLRAPIRILEAALSSACNYTEQQLIKHAHGSSIHFNFIITPVDRPVPLHFLLKIIERVHPWNV